MNQYLIIALIALLQAAGLASLLLIMVGRRWQSQMPILEPGWDNLPTPECSCPAGCVASGQESLPGRSSLTRDCAGAPASLGTYRVVCMECGNTIQVSPIRGPSIETQSICRFCAARLRMDVPGFDEPGVRQNVTPDFKH